MRLVATSDDEWRDDYLVTFLFFLVRKAFYISSQHLTECFRLATTFCLIWLSRNSVSFTCLFVCDFNLLVYLVYVDPATSIINTTVRRKSSSAISSLCVQGRVTDVRLLLLFTELIIIFREDANEY